MGLLITLYSEIREGDAARVTSQLRAQPADAVEVRINSPGGSVGEGLAIYNALLPRKPTVYIDGVAASIASLIAMAGAHIVAAENALFMVHDPWCDTVGNSTELRRTAERLDKHRDAMLRAYMRTGLSIEKVTALLADETWMSAEEALAFGFVDEIAEPLRYAAHAATCYDSYLNTPRDLLNMNTKVAGARAADAPAEPAKSPLETAPADKSLEAFRKGLASDAVTKAAHDAVMDALKARNEEITAMAAPFMGNATIRDLTIRALSDPAVSAAEVGQRILAAMGQGREPLNGGAHVAAGGGSSGGDFVKAASDALAIRAGIRIEKPHPGARDVGGMGVAEIMRACVSRSGRSFDFSTQNHGGLIRAAMSTDDFPAIVGDTLNKALRRGFEVEPSTYEAWTRSVLVPDFKAQTRPILGSAPDLLPVLEGGEYTYGALDEDKAVPYSVTKFGRIVALTWEAIVNDDLGAFLKMTQALGQAAARTEADQVYATFAANSGAGPAMQDAVNLFHATHGNLAASTATLDAAALSAARVLLRRQTAVGGGVLNLTPRFLLVSPEHEHAAEVLLAAAARSMSQGSDNALVPAWLARLELVVEARLDDSAAYLMAEPETVDTYERAWLEADNGPVVEEESEFARDVKKYKVRHVFGGRWLDWRGVVKLPIA